MLKTVGYMCVPSSRWGVLTVHTGLIVNRSRDVLSFTTWLAHSLTSLIVVINFVSKYFNISSLLLFHCRLFLSSISVVILSSIIYVQGIVVYSIVS